MRCMVSLSSAARKEIWFRATSSSLGCRRSGGRHREGKAPLTATADVSAPEQPITCLLRFNALMLSPRYVLLPVRTAQLNSIFPPRGTMGDILPAGFG
nr:hypothetical protein Iba_scaffold1083017CG0010 [Ipomoea batatas]GMD97824.1 hypothetical protein Iba_chr15cCG6270 [Ipomoea batatas]